MRTHRFVMAATFMTAASVLAGNATAQSPAAPIKGEVVVSTVQVTATVTKIDQKTREVMLRTEEGTAYTFVAGDAVKNLAQVKVGDRVTVNYTEALAYEVKKGGTTAGADTVVAAARAQEGARPAGVVAGQTTVTVKITAIDHAVPSVTFMGPKGNSKTLKVLHPEKLEGVSVGDTVEIAYTEAIAVQVEAAAKK